MTDTCLPLARRHLLPLLVAAALLLLFALVVALTGTNAALFLMLNQDAGLLPNALWANLTFTADTVFAMSLLLLVASFRPALFAPSLLLLVLGTLFVHGGKALFDAARPAAVLVSDSFQIIGPVLRHHSFPSGHSFTALGAWTLVILAVPPRGLMPLLTLALLAAASRIAVGAHWPLDVLVGSACGILMACLSAWLVQAFAWLRRPAVLFSSAALLTIAAVYMPFFDSRYPDTRLLATVMALVTLSTAAAKFWWPRVQQAKTPSSLD
ncbi:phosphatase PAP2 family protein [Oceanobacter sp. 3_MG-2023]|uniref:phosphatase PAP2 family protein n=1 Tax=Oceanobacter sp. 3_MG-2023 TaxID=3062622 RepID=UPI002736BCE7|nr:phosphatase PAP2 family protein [Oceanobacter sp. 3_MG-2023]MDP2507093.1 phosphatase PAP2 family protein [Oceanobacter sp. 3_MG-2023]